MDPYNHILQTKRPDKEYEYFWYNYKSHLNYHIESRHKHIKTVHKDKKIGKQIISIIKQVNCHRCTNPCKRYGDKCKYGFPRYPLKETLVIDKKEFDKFKNVINKDMYDKFSAKQKEREKDWKKRPIFEDLQEEKSSNKESKSVSRTWVRPKLRVRIIDRKSKYYKEKVEVNDVLSAELIQVITPSGKIVEIDPEDVETVIPKEDFAKVMIVRKEHKGQIAEILRKDSRFKT